MEKWGVFIQVTLALICGISVPFLLWKYRDYKSPGEKAESGVEKLNTKFDLHVLADTAAQAKIETTLNGLVKDFSDYRNECREDFTRIHSRIDELSLNGSYRRGRKGEGEN